MTDPDIALSEPKDSKPRPRGRPHGWSKPDRKHTREVQLTDDAWQYARAQGSASGFIERLLQEHKATQHP